MKYKFFGILVLLFSILINVQQANAQALLSPVGLANIDLSVSVNGNQATINVSGELSVKSVGPQCVRDTGSEVFSYASESAQTGVVSITAGAGLTGQTIPVTITPASPNEGDCFTKAERYSFSGSKIFSGISAGSHTVTVKVTDELGATDSKSASFTIVASSFTVSASANPPIGGNPAPVNSVVSSGSPAVFNVNANTSGGYVVVSAVGCPLGAAFDENKITYTTGPIYENCNAVFNYILSTPPLSCALDTTASPGPYYTGAGIKFEAFGGNGTSYSWSTNGGTSSFESGSNNMRNWISWSTAGSKTVSVTSGTQTAPCGTVSIATPPPGPINGVCSNPDVHYTCSQGTSANNVEGASAWTWNCNGSNGGTNASCSESKTAMSGTLTPSSSTCYISAGASTCTKLLTWTTTNPVAVSAVTSSTGTPSPSTSTNNGSQTFTIPYNNGNASIFYLYNNAVKLAEASVTPYCTAGTSFSGGVCQVTSATQPDLTASAPTPNLATVNVPRTFSSNISNIGGGDTGGPFSNHFQIASAANGGGTLTPLTSASTAALASGAIREITSPAHTFTTAGTYSVRACADLPPYTTGVIAESNEDNNCSAWTNVTVSATAGTVTGYHDQYSGTVPASQCMAVGWAAYSSDLNLDLNIRILSDGVVKATGTAGTYRHDLGGVCTDGTCSYWINLSGLITSGVNHIITAQAQNPGTGAWTTLSTSPKDINCAAPTTGTLTASNCTIASGGSSCNTSLTWTTTNPVGTSNITSNTPSANTIITTGNSGTNFSASVPYSSRTFFLNNNSVSLASVTPTATCVSGTSWDGSKCAPPAPGCTPTTSFSGSVTPASVSPGGAYNLACNFGVISGYIGGSLGSGSCSWSGWSNGTQANFNCTAGGTSGSFSNSCIITHNDAYPYCSRTEVVNNLTVSGGAISGVCSDPDDRLNPCLSGNASAITNGISSWTWTCDGEGGGGSESCEELKKKPIFKED